MATPLGRAIHGYELHERLGVGGFGAVYRAIQTTVGREVAIKVILSEFANEPEFIRRFEVEAQLVARLEHPYIVPLYDYWRDPDGAYLVMRYLRGGSLRAALKARGAWDLELAARLLDQIASALAVSHRQGVIHRDIKPENILLDEEGNAFLSDFGIAKEVGRATAQTQTGAVVGSLAYISPEQVQSIPLTPACDLYSLGVVMYEVLTGEHPFSGSEATDLLVKHLMAPLPLLRSKQPETPEALDAVLQQVTAKEPGQRFSNAPAFAAAFREALRSARAEITSFALVTAPLAAPNPYKGLRAFQEADAADFFGREALVERLISRLAGEGRFLAVVGPSGSGKSSVVKAGLVPALRSGALPGSEKWFVIESLPGSHPFEELEIGLWRIATSQPSGLMEHLRRDERGLLRAVRLVLPGEDDQLLLVVDQLEELFTLASDKAEIVRYLDALAAAVTEPRSPVRVVATLRADFYDRPLAHPAFGALIQKNTEVVLPLSDDELERAIRGPAGRVGATFETGLVETIVQDVRGQPGMLPLLQYALTELYDRRAGRLLSGKVYQAQGGVLGALGRRAEEVYTSLDSQGQELARQIFLRLVALGEGGEDTRRRVLQAEFERLTVDDAKPLPDDGQLEPVEGQEAVTHQTPPIVSQVINTFGQARLLSFDRDPRTRQPTVEVAHEALLREWPRLRSWLDGSRADVRLQRLLAAAANEWNEANREPGFLLHGARLSQFEGWAGTSQVALTQDERDYLEASLAARRASQEAEIARQRRELETAQRLAETETRRAEEQSRAAIRLRRRAWYLTIALAIAGLLAIAALIFGQRAVSNEQLASQNLATAQSASTLAVAQEAAAHTEMLQRSTQQAIAEANLLVSERLRLAAAANNLAHSGVDGEMPALLALHSLALGYTPEAHAALMQSTQLGFIQWRSHQGQTEVTAATYSPDGRYAATLEYDSSLRLWDVQRGEPVWMLDKPGPEGCTGLAFTPDGSRLVSGCGDGVLYVWDARNGEEIRTFAGDGTPVWRVSFSPDGRYILVCGADGLINLLDSETGQIRQTYSGHSGWVTYAAFLPGGKTILSAGEDRTLRQWQAFSGEPLKVITTTHTGLIYEVSTNPAGTQALTSGGNLPSGGPGEVLLWDLQTGAELQHFDHPLRALPWGIFTRDGQYILTAFTDRLLRLFDPASGALLRTFTGSAQYASAMAFSSDSNTLLSGDGDGEVTLWDFRVQTEPRLFNGHDDWVYDVAFSPDGRYLLSGGCDNLARLWDINSGKQVRVFAGHDFCVRGLVFSNDGSKILTASDDQTARLWETQTGNLLQTFAGHTDSVVRAIFSKNERSVLTSSYDGTIRQWDTQSGKQIKQYAGSAGEVFGLDLSADGQTFAAAFEDGTARLFDIQTGEVLRRFEGHEQRVVWLQFSPDGKWLATASHDGTARLWDVQSGELIRTFSGHPSRVQRATFSPDARTLLTTGIDRTVRLWDVATGQELYRYLDHTDRVLAAVFSPDGRMFASAGWDGTVRLWMVDYREIARQVCDLLVRDLTEEERRSYMVSGDAPACPLP